MGSHQGSSRREVVGGADTGAVGSIINGKLCTQPCNRKHTDDNWMGKGKREKRQQKEACNLDWGIWMSCSCNVNEMFTLLKLKCKGERDRERQGGSRREICISSVEGAGESQLKNQND